MAIDPIHLPVVLRHQLLKYGMMSLAERAFEIRVFHDGYFRVRIALEPIRISNRRHAFGADTLISHSSGSRRYGRGRRRGHDIAFRKRAASALKHYPQQHEKPDHEKEHERSSEPQEKRSLRTHIRKKSLFSLCFGHSMGSLTRRPTLTSR